MTRKCCRCERVEQGGRWLLPGTAPAGREPVTHGYCPDCYRVLLAEIETLSRGRRAAARIDRLAPAGSGVCLQCA